ncbi:Acyl-CoA Delta-4 desaturase (Delta(4)/Delta(5) fatty acid desaturase) (D4D/D5D fatty acid desaturase) (Delta-4/Delta-5 fatty acid desaturase) (FAD2) (Delta-4 desaturase) [Durusdinium trenchii]|uniref:Acyl-CoA Delta-4 desaturase (Delta(4)/Delta(5) fatty acid desaturase) (D4D/D5D fatty acid desaturase) (Delta-4/Delta-5 fatty acid desaturase) (FAD2) (Delta-4 desaturase) n=1 Tax=Durusdinium trenchii TaxID=1381693 RepID=A0ABP0RGU6_9DINO
MAVSTDPMRFLLIGPSFFWHAVANLFLAELVANVHGFMVTTFNHTGEDIYCFSSGCRVNSPTFYLRAVIGSVNCHTGGFLNDFLHGYLNYQIEHHLWPDLSMLSYAKAQPKVKAICEKHGVPYVQENIFARMVKVLRIFTGRARMRRFPEEMERKEDFMAYNDRGVAIRDGTTKPSEQDLAPAM